MSTHRSFIASRHALSACRDGIRYMPSACSVWEDRLEVASYFGCLLSTYTHHPSVSAAEFTHSTALSAPFLIPKSVLFYEFTVRTSSCHSNPLPALPRTSTCALYLFPSDGDRSTYVPSLCYLVIPDHPPAHGRRPITNV